LRRSEVRLAPRSAMATPADVGHRTLDDIACRINDEAQATPAMKKGEAKIPSVSIEATLAQARDLSLVHQRLNERGLDRESRGDDRRIDADGTLFEFHSAHSLDATAIAPIARPGFVWLGHTVTDSSLIATAGSGSGVAILVRPIDLVHLKVLS
jgi:hypothetical protein